MNATWQHLLERDHALTSRATTLIRGPVPRAIATILAHTGDSMVWLFGGVLLWRFGIDVWARAGERIVLSTALAWIASTVLKYFFQRPRPEGEQGLFYLDIDQHSLPSGHATRIGGLMVVLAGLLPLWGTLGLIVWGLLVCVSRVALGLHYVGDMVVGLIVGVGAGALLLAML
jgi:undecaprenyl-diphosphatase